MHWNKFTKEQEQDRLLDLELDILKLKKMIKELSWEEKVKFTKERAKKQNTYWVMRKLWGYSESK